MLDNDFIKEFRDAKDNDLPYKLFKSVYLISQDFNFLLNFVKNFDFGKYRSHGNGVHLRENLWVTEMTEIDNVDNFFNLVKSSYGDKYNKKSDFTMVVCENETFPNSESTGIARHFDDSDNLHWNCFGKSLWDINGDQLIMEPGDILYIKKGTVHEVKTLSKRAGIVFSVTMEGRWDGILRL